MFTGAALPCARSMHKTITHISISTPAAPPYMCVKANENKRHTTYERDIRHTRYERTRDIRHTKEQETYENKRHTKVYITAALPHIYVW